MNAEAVQDEMNRPAECPVCHSRQLSFFGRGRDRLFGLTPGTFLLLECRSCGCVCQSPVPDPSAISGFYPDEYWWSDVTPSRDGLATLLHGMERAYREFVTLDHVRFVRQGIVARGGCALLDIGCGSGTFIHLAALQGFAAYGMDISDRAVTAARESYGLPVEQGDIGSPVWAGRKFDIVTMFHVLEHLPDPGIAIDYAASLLGRDGSLVLQVPNVRSLQARLFRSRWYGLDVPRHIVNFAPRSLEILLAERGFRIVRRSRFSLRDDPPALASSLVPRLDPMGRRGRGEHTPWRNALAEAAYFALVAGALPLALAEGLAGRGATLMVEAKRGDSGDCHRDASSC